MHTKSHSKKKNVALRVCDPNPYVSSAVRKTRPRRRPRRKAFVATEITTARSPPEQLLGDAPAPAQVQVHTFVDTATAARKTRPRRRPRRKAYVVTDPMASRSGQPENLLVDDPATAESQGRIRKEPDNPPIARAATPHPPPTLYRGEEGRDDSFSAASELDSHPLPRVSRLTDLDSDREDNDERALSPTSLSTTLPQLEDSTPPALLTSDGELSSEGDRTLSATAVTEPNVSHVTSEVFFDVQAPIKGFHISSDGGPCKAVERFHRLEAAQRFANPNSPASAVQFFNGSPQKGVKEVVPAAVVEFKDLCGNLDLRHWLMHGNHTTNLVSASETTRKRAFESVKVEMQNCVALGIQTLCLHLGSFQELIDGFWQGDDSFAVDCAVEQIGNLLDAVPGVKLALENMARNNLSRMCEERHNWSLRQIKRIIDGVGDRRVMACIDICHAFIGDYDLRSLQGVRDFLADLSALGPGRVACMHVSDSSRPHGAKCDGHMHVGKGHIPLSAFRSILRRPEFLGKVPYFLETPAHSPEPRAKTDERKYDYELHLKRIEWDALEYIIRVSDSVWSEQLGVWRFEQVGKASKPARQAISLVGKHSVVNQDYHRKMKHLRCRARALKQCWKLDVLDALGGIDEALLTAEQRYALDLAWAIQDGSREEARSRRTELHRTVVASEPFARRREDPEERPAAVAASAIVAEVADFWQETQAVDSAEEADSSADEWTSDTLLSKGKKNVRPRGRPPLTKRHLARTQSDPVGTRRFNARHILDEYRSMARSLSPI